MLIKTSELTEGSILFDKGLGYLLIVQITEIKIVFYYLNYKELAIVSRVEDGTFANYEPEKSIIFPRNKQYATI